MSSLLITAAAAIAAGFVLNQQNKDQLIQSHIKVYPVLVEKIMDIHPSIRDGIAASSRSIIRQNADALAREFEELGTICRIKIWDKQGTVIWSDSQAIIGKNFSTNEHFQAATRGVVAYSIAEPTDAENETEIGFGTILEIYVPVRWHNEIVGVLELYERDEQLYENISEHARAVWAITGGFGGVIFISMFAVYYRANVSLNRAISKTEQTQQVTVLALAYQAELRDTETGKHIERTSHYVRILAERIRKINKYSGYMGGTYVADIVRSAPLHDIGKVAIPDSLLRKPGPLTSDEFSVIKKHCEYGVRVLDEAHADLPFQSFLELARQLILHHHERWDGTGYPKGLKGEDIPLSGRIMAIADVYDALRTKRPYKEPLLHADCIQIIVQDSGKQFDPEIVKVFVACAHEFDQISNELNDQLSSPA